MGLGQALGVLLQALDAEEFGTDRLFPVNGAGVTRSEPAFGDTAGHGELPVVNLVDVE